MTPIISRRSARGTLRLGAERATSGTPTESTEQPSGPTSKMERQLHEQLSAHWKRTSMVRVQFVWWNLMVSIKHLFGIHTMIPVEEWDFEAGTVTMCGLICWKLDCDYRA